MNNRVWLSVAPRALAGVLVLVSGLACSSSEPKRSYGDINISSKVDAADGLDLKAVGEMVKTAKDAPSLEKELNRQGGVNNLDLNEDGKTDFIHVTEYGSDAAKGFSLTVEPAKGEVQEVATIEVEKKEDKAHVHISGNEQIYGHGHHYHYHTPMASMLLMAYLFRPHPFYVSPFHFGMYPSYWGMGFGVASPMAYATRTRTITRNATSRRLPQRASSLQSPNRGKTASKGIRASLRNPTKSQRAFSSRNRKPTSTRGFANRVRQRGTSQRAKPTQRSRFSRGSRSSGRRSFGGRRMGGFRSRR